MVGVAQLVEPWIVIPVVVGSSPIIHPNHGPLAQLVEQWTLNPLVEGSNPSWPTKKECKARTFEFGFFVAAEMLRACDYFHFFSTLGAAIPGSFAFAVLGKMLTGN